VYRQKNGSKQKVRTYQGTVVVNDNKMHLTGKRDGFWLIVTDHSEKAGQEFTLKTKEAITPYREKEIIEEGNFSISSGNNKKKGDKTVSMCYEHNV